ncbi:hypothetical protein LTR37_011804 [Vermiconidia calcicola]|uniref:Uncharacterized protein n=1 Tax=Vermiconidia calcicola TaxID=1690605 RepID=A0ACC3N1Q7_9PEZI|nr:hypothetical protein LTR37_011804 [Vermiconidia calcicola]
MQLDTKPKAFFRTTYRGMRSPDFDIVNGFRTDRPWLATWPSNLTVEVIEQHLDRNHDFQAGRRMLISVHSSSERALNYARVQRNRLFFDNTDQDPDVWIHSIGTEALQWEIVSLTADARRTFGSIASRWATKDEWFAVGHIPAHMVVMHVQLAHGQTLGDYRSHYKLGSVPRESLPDDFVRINGSISDALQDAAQCKREMTEEEYDRQLAVAMKHEVMTEEEYDRQFTEAMKREMMSEEESDRQLAEAMKLEEAYSRGRTK